MKREKIAWMLSILLLALLALEVPRGMAQRDNDYAFVRTLVDIHRQVVDNYNSDITAKKLEDGAIEGMLNQLDPYSVYIPPEKEGDLNRMLGENFPGVGIQLDQLPDGKIEVVSPIDGSPALKAGVQAGDIILAVDGKSLDGLKVEDAVKHITGKLGSPLTLRVQHVTGEIVDLTMTRQEIVFPSVKGFDRNADNSWNYFVRDNPRIAYLRITQFTPDTADRVRDALLPIIKQGFAGLVLDLRWNPGGRLEEAEKLANLFLARGQVIVKTKGRARPEVVSTATGADRLPDFKMIVLVNEHSASASEILAGCLQEDGRAVVLGTRTYGKGSVQEIMQLDDHEGKLKLTVAYWYLPHGRRVQREKDSKEWGVEPTIVVPMDAAGQEGIFKERFEQESFHRPAVKSTTRTSPASQPATQPVDVQLEAAVNALVVSDALKPSTQTAGDFPATIPATTPVTQP